MNKESIRKGGVWAIGFAVIFLMSQDYVFFNWQSAISWMGFPSWIFWFVLVHIVLIGFFYWFSKRYWSE